jgi:hypothetical protein
VTPLRNGLSATLRDAFCLDMRWAGVSMHSDYLFKLMDRQVWMPLRQSIDLTSQWEWGGW